MNKYEHFNIIEDEFDFHNRGILTPDEITDMAYKFLWSAFQRHLHKVRIITGKGLNSSNGPVIRPLLQKYIPTLPFVHSCESAKYNEGGQGALMVTFDYE